ncbi:hypothetical protein MN608_11370 [Microdochium nivale]|nr:hypothetical protein MN608_11370 [Microdochium nivale]
MAESHLASPPDSAASSPHRRQANLAALPSEVFDSIASELDGRDLKSLRLAKTNNDPTILRYLFRHIRLSILHHDRDAFLSIASRPHLAQHVQCLDWIQYPTNPDICARWLRPVGADYVEPIDESARQIATQFSHSCWLQPKPGFRQQSDPVIEDARHLAKSWDAFRPKLILAFVNMPCLDTLNISDPTTWRAIGLQAINEFLADLSLGWPLGADTASGGGYSVSIEYLNHTIESVNHQRCTNRTASFALLRWYENPYEFFFYGKIRGQPLKQIYSIALQIEDVDRTYIEAIAKELFSAQKLQALTVKSDFKRLTNVQDLASGRISLGHTILSVFCERQSAWNSLFDLCLSGFAVKVSDLTHLISLVAPTLRYLWLGQCGITIAHVDAIASVKGLQLSEFDSEEPGATMTIEFEDILRYFKRARSSRKRVNSLSCEIRASGMCSNSLVDTGHGDVTRDYGADCRISVRRSFRSLRFRDQRYENRWLWGRAEPGGRVYYWPSTGIGEPTSAWEFIRRQNAPGHGDRYGDDPHGEDPQWDSSRGDRAVPTPFGGPFRHFVQEEPESLGAALVDGCIQIPPDATKFTEEMKQSLIDDCKWPQPSK